MRLQILVSTMHRRNLSFLDDMKVKSDVMVINQSDYFGYEQNLEAGHQRTMYSFNERGVGLSRNTALLRATGDVALIADDDIVYDEGYEQRVIKAFEDHPDADIIFFNLESTNLTRPEYVIQKVGRVHWYNSLRYGAFRIAFRTKSIHKSGVMFSLEFGGGAPYMSGEDSLFIFQSIKAGLRAYAVPVKLGVVNHETSTWFKGYTNKFFLDKGALFSAISPRFAKLFAVYYLLRNFSSFDTKKSKLELLKLLFRGVKDYTDEK